LRTRVLIVNTPSNPTGEVIESAALVDLITVCAHAKIHVILDLSYREIVFDDRDRLALPSEFVSNGHVTIVESFSKTTRLPGWRIGHVLGHAALISKLEALATHMNSGASVLCQAGVLALMESGAIDRLAESSRAHVMANVALVEQLDDNLRAVMPLPKGGFFSLLELPHDGHGRPVDCARAQQLLFQSRGVMTTAGKHFGAPGTLRISFGASLGDVAAGLRGVRNFLDELQANPGLMDCA
jgi:aspartate/methionine/tyrosine aminotransferase